MNKTGRIARGGIYTALTVILLYMCKLLPTSKLTVLAAASAVIPLSILTLDLKSSVLVYAASAILGILLGLGGIAISYLLLFGLFGFVKYYVERLRKMPLEILLKLVFFNSSTFIIFSFYKLLFIDLSAAKLPLPLIIILLQAAFLVFDYALTIIIAYINKNFVKH